jgi:hypothetical protein
MKITERKLRTIIRSVIKETINNNSDLSDFDVSDVPQHPDDLGYVEGTPEYEEAYDRYLDFEEKERRLSNETRPYEDGLSPEESDRILPPGPHGYREY